MSCDEDESGEFVSDEHNWGAAIPFYILIKHAKTILATRCCLKVSDIVELCGAVTGCSEVHKGGRRGAESPGGSSPLRLNFPTGYICKKLPICEIIDVEWVARYDLDCVEVISII